MSHGELRMVVRLMPWATVYLRLMSRMPGGERCVRAVARFVAANGFEVI